MNLAQHPLAIDLVDYVDNGEKSASIARHLARCAECRKRAANIRISGKRQIEEVCEACGWWLSEHVENPPAGCEILQAARPESFEIDDDGDWLNDLEDDDDEDEL